MVGILYDEATLSGLPDSRFTGYLYAKRLIIRQRIISTVGDVPGEERHMIYCCHCKHKWGPYLPSYTTASAFGKHFRAMHSQLPSREEEYKSVIKRMAEATTTGKRRRTGTGSNPFTISSQLAGTRQPGEIFDEQEYRRLLAMMVVETNTAFRMVEVVSFRNLMRYCNSQVPIVSGSMLYRDIHKILYRRLFKEVCQRLQLHIAEGARINLTLDAWTASNKLPFLAITAHWMTIDFELVSTLIGFERLRGSHTAENMTVAIMKVLRMYGIEDYINCITTDNASVNDAIFKELEFHLLSWSQHDGQIRCLAHVLNIAAQTVLTTLKSEAREAEVVLEGWEESGNEEIGPAATLSRLRRIIAKIRSSTTLWEALKTEAQAVKLDWLAPILDVRIRWNSTHKMIERALKLRPALDRLLTFDPSHAFQRANLTLNGSDWIVLAKLGDILHVYIQGTKFASGTTYPTLTMQLPYYQFTQNKLYRLIQGERENFSGEDSELDARTSRLLWGAADEAYKKLNLYWQKTDNHSGQAVATMLDPRMRLKVFENLHWEPEWIDDVKQKFHRVYDNYYASKETSQPDAGTEVDMLEADRVASAIRLQVGPERPTTGSSSSARQPEEEVGFEDLVFGPPESPPDQSQMRSLVDFYLEEDCADRRADPVVW